ncbi:AOS1 [Candida margitis]|uniref:AOS1 n=1 Tax=Candida margitis TaxID=1775924 RepID=UPI002225E3E2|nr:AOS1 [Candida margitis]KAI5970936.1 AOS1 [Candida margitis]
MTTETELTADEIALYDRQIRLWGMATQLRLRSTKILIINLGAVGTECVKNLVLGGLNSIEILDNSVIKEEDFAAQFFLPNDDSVVGKLKLPLVVDKVKELNSKVDLSINTSSLEDAFAKPDYFKDFDLVVATELNKSQIISLNEITRGLNIPLYVGGMHGLFGYILIDLIEHTSYNEFNQSSVPRKVNVDLSRNKTMTVVKPDPIKKVDIVTIKDVYSPLETIFHSKEIPKYASKRELRKCTVLPIIFALFEIPRLDNPEDVVDPQLLREKTEEVYKTLNLPISTFSEDYIQTLSQQAYTEFSPTAAILGGALAQEVIRFLSKNYTPMNNVVILDATKAAMPVYSM